MSKRNRNKKAPVKHEPDVTREQQNSGQLHIQETTAFSGPIPPPDILAHYNEIAPGAADRIIAMAESEVAHRQDCEKQALSSEISDVKRGQIFGFIIGLIAILSGAITALNGSEWAGAAIGSAGVIGLVSVFVYGRSNKQNK